VYENVRKAAPYKIVLTTELRDGDGRVVRTVSEARASTGPRRKSGGYGFTPRVALENVPAGSYVLHVQATSEAGPRRETSRDIPIRVH
jgi:hypothetical protein